MSLNQFPRRSFVGSSTLQTFSGTGSQTAFTLSSAQTQNECFVFVDDVAQVPGVDFTVNGTTLTFTSAPTNAAEIIVRGFGVPAPVTTVSDGAVTAAKLATGAIETKLGYTPVSPTQLSTEVANLVNSAPSTLNTLSELATALGNDANYATTITTALALKANTSSLGTLATVSPTGTPDSTKFLRGDNSWQVVAVTPTAVSDQNNTSVGYFDLPSGTTAERPVSANVGMIRFNTTLDALENYTSIGWQKVSVPVPTLTDISGNIYTGMSSTLTLTGTQFGTAAGTVRFTWSTGSKDVAVTPASSISASVSVPSEVYGLSLGTSISIKFINGDGGQSNIITKSLVGLPSGGSITTSGNDRIHTFTSSSNFVVPSGFTASATYLIVAGGGSGGGNNGGGGGAGGMLTGTYSFAANTTYPVVVGGGASGVSGSTAHGNDGSSSSVFSISAIGGGGGGCQTGTSSGNSGGSGGGGSYQSGAGGSGTAGQGNSGGTGAGGNGAGAGGGGKGASGQSAPGGDAGGAGGSGAASTITGSSVYYAGGGGGGSSTSPLGSGGTGGGGNGAQNGVAPVAGSANTGGGGGGGCTNGTYANQSAAGGSGIVIIRYTV